MKQLTESEIIQAERDLYYERMIKLQNHLDFVLNVEDNTIWWIFALLITNVGAAFFTYMVMK